MTTEDKVFIEHKINAACGGQIGRVHPEFLITADRWPKFARSELITGAFFPHYHRLLVNSAGAMLNFGVEGCN